MLLHFEWSSLVANSIGMIWKGTYALINVLMAKKKKKMPVELRNRIVSSHRSGEEFRKKFCCTEDSQKRVASIIHNRRSLKQPGLFLELASWPNWAIDGEGLWFEWWLRSWLSLSWAPWSYMQMGETYRRTNITATLHRSGLYVSVARLNPLLSEDTWKHTWNLQKST